MPTERGTRESGDYTLLAMMPVGKILPFLTAFSSSAVTAHSYAGQGLPMSRPLWSRELQDHENTLIDYFTMSTFPEEDSGASDEIRDGTEPSH